MVLRLHKCKERTYGRIIEGSNCRLLVRLSECSNDLITKEMAYQL